MGSEHGVQKNLDEDLGPNPSPSDLADGYPNNKSTPFILIYTI